MRQAIRDGSNSILLYIQNTEVHWLCSAGASCSNMSSMPWLTMTKKANIYMKIENDAFRLGL